MTESECDIQDAVDEINEIFKSSEVNNAKRRSLFNPET